MLHGVLVDLETLLHLLKSLLSILLFLASQIPRHFAVRRSYLSISPCLPLLIFVGTQLIEAKEFGCVSAPSDPRD
jgi:hypothetical protein